MQRLEFSSLARRTSPEESDRRVPVSKLKPKIHGSVLCYPGNDLSTFSERIKQLRELGVGEISFEGSSKVGNLGVIGKGCVSVVLKARLKGNDEIIALKCRRIDANRETMKRDFELQKIANSHGVGPRAISATDDFFAMEFIDAIKIGKWLERLKTRSSKKFLRGIVRDSLTQCFLLDLHGLDHGELSNPSKHILIRKDPSGSLSPKVVIIDYESAGTNRKVSNLTAVAQFYFLSRWRSEKIRKILGMPKGNSKLISLLKGYKKKPNNDNFERIMAYVRC
jgi:putative serine/threonine protein kinase